MKDGTVIEGPEVDWNMVVKEGWLEKSQSKWQTMPKVMIQYRSASFFGKTNCPQVTMGLQTQEEIYDSPAEAPTKTSVLDRFKETEAPEETGMTAEEEAEIRRQELAEHGTSAEKVQSGLFES